ncbi:DUF5050 domain-containing protein [Paenibacillus sp. J2TS4]|uniref:DUF5050 domain-containing protein n=1 Tax=Paenibacillus sp. J2TS4 TaxID=2807194 RepID=UPI001B0A0AF4|nr:DUF5050 domain-containing protein [Paenibacillus sp. J2TS4]GIP35360.1 hypothetical protein J2TS4_45700 [Paenibacillus sp. J2TS4]
MSLWIYEMKKMFFYQKGLLFIGLYFVLSTAALIIFDTPANPDVEFNSAQYSFYLDQVRGSSSEETERFLTNESRRISDANVALRKAYDDYYDGNLSEDELLAITRPLEDIVRNERGFNLVFDQYSYIREQPDNRYFLYTNGWDGLLSHDSLDLFFLLLMLVLVAPVFCYEFESKMDPLNLTVKKGTKVQAVTKIGLVLATVAVLCLFTEGIRYGFFHFKYGLDHGSYPLQSLSYFGASSKQVTLFGTFVWLAACKLFGYLSFAMLIMFASVYIKKYALTLFTSTAVVLLPYFGFSLESSKYFVPGPLGFMISTGFFRGNEYEYNIYTEQKDVVFQEVSSTAWILLFAVMLCISIGMFIGIMLRHTNVWGAGKRSHRLRPVGLMLILSLAASALSGCASNGEEGNYDIYNSSSKRSFENERYRFYADETIVFENKETGETRNLIRNPLQSSTKVRDVIYGNGSLVYYMKYDYDKSKLRETVDRFSIIEVDTATFEERIVFEKNLNADRDNFLGLNKTNVSDEVSFITTDSFFMDKHSIYLIGGGEIKRLNKHTGKMSVIVRSRVMRSVAFDGRNIYYVNDKSEVAKYDTRTDSETVLPDIVTEYFVLTDTELLYINRKDKQKIYAMNLGDFSTRKITDKSVMSFTCDGTYIYYEDKGDLKKYRIDRDGQNDTLVSD